MLGPFTFTFTLESEEFENFGKVAAGLYQTRINTRACDGANKKNGKATWRITVNPLKDIAKTDTRRSEIIICTEFGKYLNVK